MVHIPKRICSKLQTNCLSVFDHFVGLALKGLRQGQVRPNWKDILVVVVEVLPWLSPLCLVVQKNNIQFGILVFLEPQEINLRGNLQGGKCD